MLIFYALPVQAEVIDWSLLPLGDSINDIAVGERYVWCATNGSLVRWDKTNGIYIQYTETDGLLDNNVLDVELAGDILWIGSSRGLQRYDGSTFTSYTDRNSGLVHRNILALYAIDSQYKNIC